MTPQTRRAVIALLDLIKWLCIVGIVLTLGYIMTACSDPQRFRKEPTRDWCGDLRMPAEKCI
jgi:hypothetical protein